MEPYFTYSLLSQSGCSNEVMLNNCVAMINHFEPPYATIFNWTNVKRFRYYAKNLYEDYGHWSKKKNTNELEYENKIDGYDLLKLMSHDSYHINSLNYLKVLKAKALLKK